MSAVGDGHTVACASRITVRGCVCRPAAPVPPVPDVREVVARAVYGGSDEMWEKFRDTPSTTHAWFAADRVLAVPAIATALRGPDDSDLAAGIDVLLAAYPDGCDGLGCSGWDDIAKDLRALRATAPSTATELAQHQAILAVIGEHRRVRNVRACSAGGCAWRPSRSGSTSDPEDTMQRHQQFNAHVTDVIMERLAAL